MITIGRLAEKYGVLPHVVRDDADSYDFMIYDVLATYDQYMEQKKSGKLIDGKLYGLTTEEMMRLKDLGKNG
jgi:hypothetical protein